MSMLPITLNPKYGIYFGLYFLVAIIVTIWQFWLYYIPSEITWLLKSLDHQKIDIYGVKLGAFSRKGKVTVQDFEM